ncbi:arylamine N-acetyltransferase family protein [Paenibacillus piri]|uniref:Arylamine N-acetyltransferase n=1 Tax=Paenibacillus piri TaxID=2547395 RepID=A0A4R5KJ00_9BACL|nr:arylamine N-acetyltransferase [Paenibacillus piri]TDF94755.1 arylamine N-acetyltransferase [Paenibacillus piri]
MSELNALFRQRIGLSEDETITFASLNHLLEQTATIIPFENLRIIEGKTNDITKDSLMNKILVNKEGGLCYELNSILYFFLVDNGFNVVLTRGVVYNHDAQVYSAAGRTHVTILLTHEDQTYLIDTGFGGNLPLKPVPLSGEPVSSANGQSRIRKTSTEHGDYVFEQKLKYKHTDWKTGYAFDSGMPVTDVSEMNEIQKIIAHDPKSSFNKNPLVTRLTNEGNMTLTDTSFTRWSHGIVTKESIDRARFKELLKEHFGM